MQALKVATRDAIIGAGLGYTIQTCNLMFEGKPPPNCGAVFLAVHGGTIQDTARDSLDELYSVIITLTMRVSIPYDRGGTDLLAKAESGADERLRKLRAKLKHKYTGLLSTANAAILASAGAGETVYGFSEPFTNSQIEQPRIVGSDWLHGDPNSTECGIAQNLVLSGARRLQPLELMH